ncbi:MAG: helix-turn-helix transcriptional regulator [Lewinellaceae bacterium]|nr:helix-turn-helix transcriptional regulator [Lewinellaceae bacterium]MCB9289846.1 helix-turn-helix transcriptional regulator [Lewinellaceae bacterium]
MSVLIKEYQPSPLLRPYVELFWEGQFNTNQAHLLVQKVLPNGYLEAIIHLSDLHCELPDTTSYRPSSDYTLIGLFAKPYEVHFKGPVKAFGIRFKPEGLYPLLGVPAAEVRGSFTDMDAFAGRDFREYCHRMRTTRLPAQRIALAEAFLQKRMKNKSPEMYYLNRAAEMIRRRNGLISIEELAHKAYISPRQLEREFKKKIGLTPKGYMRLARLNEVNRLLQKNELPGLTAIAFESGYADQAHFIRDFKQFTGEKPTVFLKERERFIVNPNMAE